MNLKKLNQICFTVCIICIVIGTALSLFAIWADIHDSEFLIKSGLTIAVLFVASALTLSVSKTADLRNSPEDRS